MSEKHDQRSPKGRSQSSDSLVVWGERRKEPDWDTFIAALLAYALREVGEAPEPPEETHD